MNPRPETSIPTGVMGPLLMGSVLFGTLSCAAHHAAAPDSLERSSHDSQPQAVRIAGYRLSDGRDYSFDGYVMVSADSLVFSRPDPEQRAPSGSAVREFAYPRNQVTSVKVVSGVSVGRSVLFGVSLLGFIALMWAIVGGPIYNP